MLKGIAMLRPAAKLPVLIFLALIYPSAAGAASDAAFANYPDKPIRLIVPQGIGSATDVITRVLGVKLGEVLSQQIVIDNRSGASGMIGIELTAHASPDGYTLLGTSAGIQVVAPQLHKKLPFDPFRDLVPISLYAVTQNVLAVHPSLPAKSVREFVAFAKAAPGKLNYASAGTGTQSHLASLQFVLISGIDAVHVPYKGGGALIAAVIANEAQFTVTPLPGALPHIKSGRLRALGTGGDKRSTQLPEIPTIAEAGIPYHSTGWTGLLAPTGTPKAILDKLRAALLKVMSQPDMREQIERQGADVVTSTSAEFAKFMREEWDRYGEAIKAAKIKVE